MSLRLHHAAAVLATALLAGLLFPVRQYLHQIVDLDVRTVSTLTAGFELVMLAVTVVLGGAVGRWIGRDVDVPRSYPAIGVLYLVAGSVGILVGFAAAVVLFPESRSGDAITLSMSVGSVLLSTAVPFALAGLVGAALAEFSRPRADAA